jgi:Cu-Zn family superoxide dismutase
MLIAATACVNGASISPNTPNPSANSVTVQLKDAQGHQVASATIIEGLALELASSARLATSPRETPSPASGVTVTIQVRDVPAGTHGFHVHSVGQCLAPDFTSAGPVLNPDNRTHGVKSPNGPQAGDLPSLSVDKDGTALAAFFVGHLTMSQIEASPTGSSLLIDANPDDDITSPSGNSGAHIACGVIRPGAAPSPSPSPTPTPSPPPSPSPTPTPNTAETGMRTVAFSGLPQGTFPAHLHSICNGRQSFHIAVLNSLVVNSTGRGAIAVPNSDFEHGWCVIVYGNAALNSVLTTQSI